jgi:hypothetical protein
VLESPRRNAAWMRLADIAPIMPRNLDRKARARPIGKQILAPIQLICYL